MGSCVCCTQPDVNMQNLEHEVHAEDIQANSEINKYMHKKSKTDKSIMKLLLLGVGSSGKSTLFKQIECILGNGFDDDYMESNVTNIRDNCIESMIKLLKQSSNLVEKHQKKQCSIDLSVDTTVSAIKLLTSQSKYKKVNIGKINDDNNNNKTDVNDDDNKDDPDDTSILIHLKSISSAIKLLWSLQGIKATFSLRQLFSLYENIDYFFNKVDVLFNIKYIPTKEDMIKTRIRTTGIIEKKYTIENVPFHIFDVGGQRNERKKWIQLFEGVDGLIFVAALSHYASVLFEDENKNSMIESLEVFDEIINLKWFELSQIILFLNKEDIFRQRLRDGIPLTLCFGDKYDGPNYNDLNTKPNNMDDDEWFIHCYDESIQYITKEFLARNRKTQMNTIYIHITDATSQNNVEKVFSDITTSMIKRNLMRSGVLR